MANTTWSSTDKTAGITLSGTNNVVATVSVQGGQGVRTIDRQATGKFYFEQTVSGVGVMYVGIGGAGVSLTATVPNGPSFFISNLTSGSNYWINGTQTALPGNVSTVGTTGWAVDLTNSLIWVRNGAAGNWNGSATANPATGVGGISLASMRIGSISVYPLSITNNASGNVLTANFGDSAFTGAVPSGFTSGFTSGATPAVNEIVTQVGAEVWAQTSPPMNVTQAAAEVWAAPAQPPMQVTQVAAEVWINADVNTVLTQSSLVRETLFATAGSLRNSSLVREVLRSTTGIVGFFASIADTVSSSDALTFIAPLDLLDTVTASDSWSEVMAAYATLTDSETISDLFPRSYLAGWNDTITSDDTFAPIQNYVNDWEDVVQSRDHFVTPTTLFKSFSVRPLLSASGNSKVNFRAYAAKILYSSNPALNFVEFANVSRKGLVWLKVPSTKQVPGIEVTPNWPLVPTFPSPPYGFPVKVKILYDTTIGTIKSLRETRIAQQQYPIFEIDLKFEELRDQTQNQIPDPTMIGFKQYEEQVQVWLAAYGQWGLFTFDAPWDDSRANQYVGTGDGTSWGFNVFYTWGEGNQATLIPVGMINQIYNTYVNGVVVDPTLVTNDRNNIYFHNYDGTPNPPPAGSNITMDFSFYYLCRFTADEQDFEEFAKNRWSITSLKFRTVIWLLG